MEINKDLAWKNVDDHMVIIDAFNGSKVHHLDGIGPDIFQGLIEKKEPLDIMIDILNKYDVSFEELNEDVSKFFEELLEKNIISL